MRQPNQTTKELMEQLNERLQERKETIDELFERIERFPIIEPEPRDQEPLHWVPARSFRKITIK